MSDGRTAVTIPDKMEGNEAKFLVDSALPVVAMPPPLEGVANVAPDTTASDIDASVVAKLKLDGVGRPGLLGLCLAMAAVERNMRQREVVLGV